MTSKLFSDWYALGQAQLPAAQGQLARAIQSALAFASQWQALQADAATALLHQQLGTFKAQRELLGVAALLDLQQSVRQDLAAQQQALARALTARAERCLDDLGGAAGKDDIAIVAAGFLKDLGATLEQGAEQGFTVLNAASAAATVLTQQALARAIDGAPAD